MVLWVISESCGRGTRAQLGPLPSTLHQPITFDRCTELVAFVQLRTELGLESDSLGEARRTRGTMILGAKECRASWNSQQSTSGINRDNPTTFLRQFQENDRSK